MKKKKENKLQLEMATNYTESLLAGHLQGEKETGSSSQNKFKSKIYIFASTE